MKKSLLFALILGFTSPLLAAPAPQSLPAKTRAQIEALLRHPGIQSAHIGLAVVALGSAKTPAQFPATHYDGYAQPLLFGRDEQKRFTPASNFKLFTAAWALQQLGPNAVFTTRVVETKPLATRPGAWPVGVPYPGIATLYGDGDPSLSSADLATLAKEIAAQKPGALIVRASEALFPKGEMNAEEGGGRYPEGWTLDDLTWYYGPPVGALALNRNQVDLTLTGAASVGDAALVASSPEAPFPIFAPVITVQKGDPRAGELQWTRGDNASALGQTLSISGFLAPGQSQTEGVAVPDPRAWAQSVLDASLRENGVQVVEPEGFYGQKDGVVIASHDSPPFSTLLQRFLKNSDNLYGEMLLRRAAISLPADPLKNADGTPFVAPKNPQISSSGMAARAHGAMFAWLKQSGVPTAGLRLSDGCGLSRYNLVTPISVARLLGAAEKIGGGAAFYSALPIAGVDGTLRNRMKGTAAEKNARAKTGSFSTVSTLSGYVTTRDGQRLAVSLLTNFADGDLSRRFQNRVFATLAAANFSAK